MSDDLFYPRPPLHRVVQQAVESGRGIPAYRMWGRVWGVPTGTLTDRDLFLLAWRRFFADTR